MDWRVARSILDLDHHFIGMNHAHLAAHQLARQIGIGMGRVEQFHPIAKMTGFHLQLGEPRFARIAQAQVFAPGKQPRWPCYRQTGHHQQSD